MRGDLTFRKDPKTPDNFRLIIEDHWGLDPQVYTTREVRETGDLEAVERGRPQVPQVVKPVATKVRH